VVSSPRVRLLPALATPVAAWLSCGAGQSAGDAGQSNDGGPASRLGAHAIKVDAYGHGSSPLTTAAVTSQPSGSTFVVFVGYHQPGSVTDSKGNTYTAVGAPITFSSEAGSYFAAFVCVSCTGGGGHTFSFNKAAGDFADEATLMAVEALGGPAVDAFIASDSFANPIAAGPLTTTHAGDVLVLAALGNSFSSPDNYTPSAGFTLLDQDTNGTNSMAGADAIEVAGVAGAYSGTLASSQTTASGGSAIFLIALGKP
jgi:hypothetical protein